jgi:hypothetical protein
MPNNADSWLVRAKALASEHHSASERIQFAVSFLSAIYGPQSPQLQAFNTAQAQYATRGAFAGSGPSMGQEQHAVGTILNTIAEIEGGLITSLRAQVAGEVLGELVTLGKSVLEDDTESAKNVSAVLIAAAFEDLMRRMGAELAAIVGRPKLEDVVNGLKVAGVLKGGEVGTAQSYLKFRNDALHADWAKVQKSQVNSCTAFIEVLLVKHFS